MGIERSSNSRNECLDLYRSLLLQPGEGNGTPLQYSCLENPWTEEPGGLQSMGSQRVGHDWATSLSLYCYERHSHIFSRLFLMATLKRSNCFHSADKETEAHMLADVVLGILTPSLGLLPLYDVSLLFLLKVHSKAATLPLAGKKQCA